MENPTHYQPDYGTGKKNLTTYITGLILCSALTFIAFWAVLAGRFSKTETFFIIYSAALAQFFVQLVCFLRLNLQTWQARTNVLSLLFMIVTLLTIVIGSLWIMANLNSRMM